ncbi:hypothetical protein, unknown function [Leishmania tarentolae]|uniref:Uncharacterized protein n=1 Tax=Leishmania tarentolae TaxID=5689 RepID=A0A640KNB6_LEITA|nr:hypothetical protein, unknown function [Leishmania tarentolae]
MLSSADTTVDAFLLVFPVLFGVLVPFVVAIGVYQCSSYRRVKVIYNKRIVAIREKLCHRLCQYELEGLVSIRQKVREHGLNNWCELSRDDDDDTSPGNNLRKEDHSAPSGSQASDPSNSKTFTDRGDNSCSSFILEDVSMLESEEGDSDGSQ